MDTGKKAKRNKSCHVSFFSKSSYVGLEAFVPSTKNSLPKTTIKFEDEVKVKQTNIFGLVFLGKVEIALPMTQEKTKGKRR
jgi:hypothetical protein